MSLSPRRTGNYLLLAAIVAGTACSACGKKEENSGNIDKKGDSGVHMTNRPDSGALSGEPKSSESMVFDSAAVIQQRTEKDRFFREEGSPIPDEKRGSFTGLRYYPVNPALAFDLKLERFDQPQPFKMAATKGDVRPMRRIGKFSFTVYGKECTLSAFSSEKHPESIFVPFRDETGGTETYEVGRYLDLPVREDDRYLLDFNMAYNPYCAYNSGYTCPMVPLENVLKVPIRAGEMLPAESGH